MKKNKTDFNTHNAFPYITEDKQLYGLSKLEYAAIQIASGLSAGIISRDDLIADIAVSLAKKILSKCNED